MSTKREIYDALSDDSSAEGCDPDWCREILYHASESDLNFVLEAIRSGNQIHTDNELRTSLIRDEEG